MLSPYQYCVHFLLAFCGALGLCLKEFVSKEEQFILAQQEGSDSYDIWTHSSSLHAHTSETLKNIAMGNLFLDEWVYRILVLNTRDMDIALEFQIICTSW